MAAFKVVMTASCGKVLPRAGNVAFTRRCGKVGSLHGDVSCVILPEGLRWYSGTGCF